MQGRAQHDFRMQIADHEWEMESEGDLQNCYADCAFEEQGEVAFLQSFSELGFHGPWNVVHNSFS